MYNGALCGIREEEGMQSKSSYENQKLILASVRVKDSLQHNNKKIKQNICWLSK